MRTPDEERREIARRAASGDEAAEAELVDARLRAGEVEPWRVELADLLLGRRDADEAASGDASVRFAARRRRDADDWMSLKTATDGRLEGLLGRLAAREFIAWAADEASGFRNPEFARKAGGVLEEILQWASGTAPSSDEGLSRRALALFDASPRNSSESAFMDGVHALAVATLYPGSHVTYVTAAVDDLLKSVWRSAVRYEWDEKAGEFMAQRRRLAAMVLGRTVRRNAGGDEPRRELARQADAGDREAALELARLEESEDGAAAAFDAVVRGLIANANRSLKRLPGTLLADGSHRIAFGRALEAIERLLRLKSGADVPLCVVGAGFDPRLADDERPSFTGVAAAFLDGDDVVVGVTTVHIVDEGYSLPWELEIPVPLRDGPGSSARQRAAWRKWASRARRFGDLSRFGAHGHDRARAPLAVVRRWLTLVAAGDLPDAVRNPGEDEELRALKREAEAGGLDEALSYAEALVGSGRQVEAAEWLAASTDGLSEAAARGFWDSAHDLYRRYAAVVKAGGLWGRELQRLRRAAGEADFRMGDTWHMPFGEDRQREQDGLRSVIDRFLVVYAEEALLGWPEDLDRWLRAMAEFGRAINSFDDVMDSREYARFIVEARRLSAAVTEPVVGREFLIYRTALDRLGILEKRKGDVSDEAASAWEWFALDGDEILVSAIDAEDEDGGPTTVVLDPPAPFRLRMVSPGHWMWNEYIVGRWLEGEVELPDGTKVPVRDDFNDPIWYVIPVGKKPEALSRWKMFWVHGIGRWLDGRVKRPDDWVPANGLWPS